MTEDKTVKQSEEFNPTISDKFMEQFFRQKRQLIIRTWITAGGIETTVEQKKVKLGALDVNLRSGKYTIDYTKVQNIKGQLIYNTKHRVANGSLSFVVNSSHDVDAKIRKSMSARDNLTAIWSRWQLPLLACIIAMIVAIIAISILAIIYGQLTTANNCLLSENCMIGKIAQLRVPLP